MTTNITVAAKNTLLDSLQITHASLHSDDPELTGANEISSPNYARQTIAFSASSDGTRTLQSTVVFSMTGGDNVAWVGYWDNSEFLLAQSVSAASFSIEGDYSLLAPQTVISL